MNGPVGFEPLAAVLPDFDAEAGQPLALVIVPSMSFDQQLLRNVLGIQYYEERQLALLLQLRDPQMHLVYCSSTHISDEIVDYYLDLIPAVPASNSRRRLTMVACDDTEPVPLTQKLLDRPDLLRRIESAVAGIPHRGVVAMNTTALEGELAQRLDMPLLGNPPAVDHLGSKSGSRECFRAAGVPMPAGFERLHSQSDVISALADLKALKPDLQAAVVKLEEGFSGEGNAVYRYEYGSDAAQIAEALPGALKCQAPAETYQSFMGRFDVMGGIVEEFLPGVHASPSGQGYIGADGAVLPLSTHDQVLGGRDGQVFEGSTFPAEQHYRMEVQDATLRVGEVLRGGGALGRYAVDFVEADDGLFAIEINLRQGGTTHPMLTMTVVTEGAYDPGNGTFLSAQGAQKCYYATDNLQDDRFRGMHISEVITAAVEGGLTYDPVREHGCVFHMLGALREYGKLGVTCVADTREQAADYYRAVTDMMWSLRSD